MLNDEPLVDRSYEDDEDEDEEEEEQKKNSDEREIYFILIKTVEKHIGAKCSHFVRQVELEFAMVSFLKLNRNI